MTIKYSNDKAMYFNKLYDGKTADEIFNEIVDNKGVYIERYGYSEKDVEKLLTSCLNEILEVQTFLKRMKLLEKPEQYGINGWGYDQTNYENFKIVGQVGASMVAILESASQKVFTIQKSKYTRKEWTNLDSDGIRSTLWQSAYSGEELHKSAYQNAYNGH